MKKTDSQKLVAIAEGVYTQAVKLKTIVGPCNEVNQLADISAGLYKTAAADRTDDCDGLNLSLPEATKRANL